MTATDKAIRILLVDDDVVDRQNVKRALNRSGLTVETSEASTGMSALEVCEAADFDCLLLDYRLPDFDGADLLERIRRLRCEAPPTIFLTGQGSEDLAVRVIEAGALDYIAKDEVSPSVLRRAVRYALSRQQYLQHLNRLALHDDLTGLANRALFHHQISQGIAHAKRLGTSAAVFLVDLDNFKDINDTLGHESGDHLLKLVAGRLATATRADESLARLGGDEFAIVATDLCDDEAAATLAGRMLEGLAEPFDIDGHQCLVAASVGISVCPRDGDSSDRLLGNADLALYKAKHEGGGTYCFYDGNMTVRAHARRELQTDLRAAVKERQFDLHYQPKIEPVSGQIVGVEALLRWNRPNHGFVSPAEFIPAAEACGLMQPLGAWVLRRACEQSSDWQAFGCPSVRMAVNLSPRQLVDDSIVGTVKRLLGEFDIDPVNLELEFTESAVMSNLAVAARQLARLSALGVTIAIDDFGIGYSSLARLQQLPVQKLKIDRSLVSGLDGDHGKAAIVEAIIALAQKLGLAIVAEGVETEAELEFVRERGCDEVQGYHFCRPLPADQIAEKYGLAPVRAGLVALAN